MVRMTYLGPGASCRMKIKRAYLDLSEELRSCRPLGPEYRQLETLLLQMDATNHALFGETVTPPMRPPSAYPPRD